MYTNELWCRDAVVVSIHCSPHVELMTVKCRPFGSLHTKPRCGFAGKVATVINACVTAATFTTRRQLSLVCRCLHLHLCHHSLSHIQLWQVMILHLPVPAFMYVCVTAVYTARHDVEVLVVFL